MAMTLKMIQEETGEEVYTYSFDQRRRVHSAEMVTTVQALSDILQSQMNIVVAQLDSLFLATATGRSLTPSSQVHSIPEDSPQTSSQDDEASGLDESSFEIIRER
jgi:hypothetical protein